MLRQRIHTEGAAATIALVLLGILGFGAVMIHWRGQSGSGAGAQLPTARSNPPVASTTGTGAQASHAHTGISLNLHAHSTTDPHSIWVVVNKTHPLRPLQFSPRLTVVRGYQVARPAAQPLAQLLNAAGAHGLGLQIESAYRSYGYQVSVHEDDVENKGAAAADRVSARPGYSEHQTGLAVDVFTPNHSVCDLDPCFAGTRAGRWVAQNAWRYGFIVRYPPGKRAITGYSPEPWHIRYIGRPLAAAMHRSGIETLEQVFHIPGGNYR